MIAPLPWSFDFESPANAVPAGADPKAAAAAAEAPPMWWTRAPGKVFQRTVEGVGKVLVRPRDETVGRRAKVAMGPANMHGYTIEADVRGTEQRRQRGDVGVINQRYALVLFGNGQKLRTASMAGGRRDDRARSVQMGAEHLVSHEAASRRPSDGTAQVRGKVWPTGQPEPAAWTIERSIASHTVGSPGIYGDGISESTSTTSLCIQTSKDRDRRRRRNRRTRGIT